MNKFEFTQENIEDSAKIARLEQRILDLEKKLNTLQCGRQTAQNALEQSMIQAETAYVEQG